MRLLTGLIFFATAIAFGQSPDWQVAVGGNPARIGRSTWEGPTGPNLLWSGGVSSTVGYQGACEGDRFFVARTFDPNDRLQGTLLLAYDLDTGEELWRKSLPVDFPNTDWRNKVTGVRNGVVYATRAGNGGNYSFLYALDASTGNVIWRSAHVINEDSTQSVCFAPNGDILAGGSVDVKRIRATDGTTMWICTRSVGMFCTSVAAFGNRAYTWENVDGQGMRVSVIDLATGLILYRAGGFPLGGFAQADSLMVGEDGTVYATQNVPEFGLLYALTDTGAVLFEKWRFATPNANLGSTAVGPDGTVYTYGRSNPPTVVRLNPSNGAVLNTSPPIPSDLFFPRIAVDAAGRVYLTNGANTNGVLNSYDPDLTLRWSVPVPNVFLGGPVIGKDGTLVVCGTGADIRAYRDSWDTSPLSFHVFRGILESGNLASLKGSDDDRLVVRNGMVLNVSEPPIAVTIEGVSPIESPSTFRLRVEARVSTAGLSQELLAFNWNTGAYDLMDARSGTLADQTVSVDIPADTRYIQFGSRAIRARIQYRKTGPVASGIFAAGIDQAVWTIRP